jgi:1,4-alpha-glucan branching enzyme
MVPGMTRSHHLLDSAQEHTSGIAKSVKFSYAATEAEEVYLVGDFNDWHPMSHPMRRQLDGTWFLEVEMARGDHQYVLLADGKVTLDPGAPGTVLSEHNGRVSFLCVR